MEENGVLVEESLEERVGDGFGRPSYSLSDGTSEPLRFEMNPPALALSLELGEQFGTLGHDVWSEGGPGSQLGH